MALVERFSATLRVTAVFGEWMCPDYFENGCPPADSHASLVASSYNWIVGNKRDSVPQVEFSWDPQSLGAAGSYGETWSEMHARAGAGLEKLLAIDQPATVVIVTHGSVYNSLLAHLKNEPQLRKIPIASFDIVCLDPSKHTCP